MRVLSRAELTAALAARQMLIERERVGAGRGDPPPHPAAGPAPAGAVHRAGGPPRRLRARATSRRRSSARGRQDDDQAAHAAPRGRRRLSGVRPAHPPDADADVAQDATRTSTRRRSAPSSAAGCASRGRTPRSASGSGATTASTSDAWTPVIFARTLLPLVQLPPAGYWDDARRGRGSCSIRARCPTPPTPRRSSSPATSTAFGPASRRDVAAWAGVAQRDFAEAFERVETVSFRDEHGTELLDLPGRPLPPADTPLPPRFLAHWDQPLLAYAERDRIIPPEVQPLKLTLSGDPTVTVDGRVAASWSIEGRPAHHDHAARRDQPRGAARRSARRPKRTARFCEPDATSDRGARGSGVPTASRARWRAGRPERGRPRRACRRCCAGACGPCWSTATARARSACRPCPGRGA